MKYEAYKCRGYGFGLKYDFTGLIGQYETELEAKEAADKYTQECLHNNIPDCYDMGCVRRIKTVEPIAES